MKTGTEAATTSEPSGEATPRLTAQEYRPNMRVKSFVVVNPKTLPIGIRLPPAKSEAS